jgi:CheY-like chemotaxis protein
MHDGERPTILIIDDDRQTREALRGILEEEGYRAEVAESGVGLLETLPAEPVSAILLDVRMSWMDGFDICDALKHNERFAAVPVFFTTACVSDADRAHAKAVGGTDFFAKPLDVTRLLERLGEVVGK